jgi:hypothetical protein
MATTQPEPQLETAHVLFPGIVGYSALLMGNQRRSLEELQELVRLTPEFARALAQDDSVRLPTGDGIALVFFRDPVAPLRCAMELARALRSRPHLRVRMGRHTGPVYRVADINARANVSGGGINFAQHLPIASRVTEALPPDRSRPGRVIGPRRSVVVVVGPQPIGVTRAGGHAAVLTARGPGREHGHPLPIASARAAEEGDPRLTAPPALPGEIDLAWRYHYCRQVRGSSRR